MTNPKLQTNPKSKISNLKRFGFGVWCLFVIWSLVLVIFPLFAFAEDFLPLVPCTGVDCTFCHFFTLFQNIFNFVVKVLTPSIAVIGMVWGGYKYITAGGNEGNVTAAKKIILNTVIGMVIVYGSFVVASSLVSFFANTSGAYDFGFNGTSFTFKCGGGGILSGDVTGDVKRILEGDEVEVSEDIAFFTSSTEISGIRVVDGINFNGVNSEVKLIISQVAKNLQDKGLTLEVVSGVRSLAKQKELVAENCTDGATSSKQCDPQTCIPKDAIGGSNCPHISGNAVDVYGVESNGYRCGARSECQDKVIQAMRSAGFCNLGSERWHFELESQIADNRKGSFDCP